jgi:hypothetical protein
VGQTGTAQRVGYYPNFTVFEFVEYVALLKEMPQARVRPAVVRAIERVELEGRARSKLKTLSGGMLRRVGFRTLLREIGQHGAVPTGVPPAREGRQGCRRSQEWRPTTMKPSESTP